MAATRPAPKRETDRAAIADWYVQGIAQHEMAGRLGIDEATVSRDLVWLHTQWAARYAAAIQAYKIDAVTRIDALERTYWAAWEASCEEARTTTQVAAPDATGKPTPLRATVTTAQRLGNPAYLSGVQWCISERLKIVGGYAPTKVAPTTPDGEHPYGGELASAYRKLDSLLAADGAAGVAGEPDAG
jgi:hypothetical protein